MHVVVNQHRRGYTGRRMAQSAIPRPYSAPQSLCVKFCIIIDTPHHLANLPRMAVPPPIIWLAVGKPAKGTDEYLRRAGVAISNKGSLDVLYRLCRTAAA